MLDKGVVEVSSTEVSVVSGRLDGELSLGEGDNGDRVVGVSDVDKDDVSGLLGRLGQVSLGDSVAKRDSSGVVDQSEGVETGNLGGVVQRSSLDVGVPSRNGDDDVGDGLLELSLGGVLQLAEVRSDELSEGELGRLAEVVNLMN